MPYHHVQFPQAWGLVLMVLGVVITVKVLALLWSIRTRIRDWLESRYLSNTLEQYESQRMRDTDESLLEDHPLVARPNPLAFDPVWGHSEAPFTTMYKMVGRRVGREVRSSMGNPQFRRDNYIVAVQRIGAWIDKHPEVRSSHRPMLERHAIEEVFSPSAEEIAALRKVSAYAPTHARVAATEVVEYYIPSCPRLCRLLGLYWKSSSDFQ